MKFLLARYLTVATILLVSITGETIQLQPTQGILIPAPIAQSIRVARAQYGGTPSYSSPGALPAAAFAVHGSPGAGSFGALAAPSSGGAFGAPAAPQAAAYPALAPSPVAVYTAPSAPSAPQALPTSAYSAPVAPSYSSPASPAYSAPAFRPATIPAPPCPKNYLFSCQPSLSPVPCAPASYSAPTYSSQSPMASYSALQGSYSHYVPQYAAPPFRRQF